jgi:hypothetical protein
LQKMANDLLASVAVKAGAAGDLRRRVAVGDLHIEEFGCALRIAGPGVDILIARFATVTADDLEPATRSR